MTNSEPSLPTATPTGRPQTLPSSVVKPVRKSSYSPVALPFLSHPSLKIPGYFSDLLWKATRDDLKEYFQEILAKAPEKRYQTARKFAESLKRILEGKPPQDADEIVEQEPAQGSEAETEFWNEVKDSNDADDLALYIEQFPAGVFVELAQRKVAELRGKKA